MYPTDRTPPRGGYHPPVPPPGRTVVTRTTVITVEEHVQPQRGRGAPPSLQGRVSPHVPLSQQYRGYVQPPVTDEFPLVSQTQAPWETSYYPQPAPVRGAPPARGNPHVPLAQQRGGFPPRGGNQVPAHHVPAPWERGSNPPYRRG